MVVITPELVKDCDAMCALLGPLDFLSFCDGYQACAGWIGTAGHADHSALARAS